MSLIKELVEVREPGVRVVFRVESRDPAAPSFLEKLAFEFAQKCQTPPGVPLLLSFRLWPFAPSGDGKLELRFESGFVEFFTPEQQRQCHYANTE